MTSVQKDAAATGVNVQTLLNEHPFSGFQWVIFALCFLIVLLDGFDTAAIGYIAPSLITEWGVSRSQIVGRGYWKLDVVNHPDHDYGDEA